MTWCFLVLAMAGTAFGQPKEPLKQRVVDLGGEVKMEFVLIPAGEFLMGSPDSDQDALSDEKPQHAVRITRPFYLGKYEVTQEQWQAVLGANPSDFQGAKNPVDRVTWADCQVFLAALNASSVGGKDRFALPTEAQWEYACRAGTTARFSAGDDVGTLDQEGWYRANSGGQTHPVGEKRPNAWGLCDMHGNVWEWCADWLDWKYYSNSPAVDPMGPALPPWRIFRGGGWDSGAAFCRSASRLANQPDYRIHALGLRVSLVPVE